MEKEHSSGLSKRQVEVFRLLAQGLTVSQTALELDISQNTVKTHRRNLYRNLHVRSGKAAIKKNTNGELFKPEEMTQKQLMNLSKLTEGEKKVLIFMANDPISSIRSAVEGLYLSEGTIKTHLNNARRKLEVGKTAQAISLITHWRQTQENKISDKESDLEKHS